MIAYSRVEKHLETKKILLRLHRYIKCQLFMLFKCTFLLNFTHLNTFWKGQRTSKSSTQCIPSYTLCFSCHQLFDHAFYSRSCCFPFIRRGRIWVAIVSYWWKRRIACSWRISWASRAMEVKIRLAEQLKTTTLSRRRLGVRTGLEVVDKYNAIRTTKSDTVRIKRI